MLLSLLSRKAKLKFLDLAMHMVSVDGNPNKIEKRLLNIMLAEVGDDIALEYQFSLSDNFAETIAFFQFEPKEIKNIVYLNLYKITMVDGFYNTAEHFFLEDVRKKFEITETKKRQIIRLIYSERDLRDRARRTVSE
jgi:hypothetical protein